MDIKQDVVTIPHAIQYITSAVPLSAFDLYGFYKTKTVNMY